MDAASTPREASSVSAMLALNSHLMARTALVRRLTAYIKATINVDFSCIVCDVSGWRAGRPGLKSDGYNTHV